MDDAGDGESERGGMIEAEDDEGEAEAGPEEEEETTTKGGAGEGMGTDMVVMSDAIASNYALGSFVAFSSWWFCRMVSGGTSLFPEERGIKIVSK